MNRSKSESELETVGSQELLKSPLKPRYADRFVPSRAGNSWHMTFPETPSSKQKTNDDGTPTEVPLHAEYNGEKTPVDKDTAYSCLLKNEVLGYDYDTADVLSSPKRRASRKLFHYDSSERPLNNLKAEPFSPYSSSPVSSSSHKFVRTPTSRKRRRISKYPFKVLDAPELADDYYLNLIDWSSKDVISVGLGNTVYSWSAATANVARIADFSDAGDHPTSVKWNGKGDALAVGSQNGIVRIYDIETSKVLVERAVHSHRIGALEWNGDMLFSGSRDKTILSLDVRCDTPVDNGFTGHGQEVCGLKWSSFNSCLASGGNDNSVYVWSLNAQKPLNVFKEHTAAVKALAWSPHERHILASGGGSSDRCIKFWNTITGSCISSVNTESQVCNLAWSPFSRELVSTHGYAHNHISVWKYPALKAVACLKGHTQRVLYMAMSPDGESVCTGAPDETLRFWKVFEKCGSRVKKSPLDLFDGIR